MKKIVVIMFLVISIQCFAGTKDSHNLTVEQISVWGSTGHLLVQTNPKHSIEGLSCDSDYWLKLNKNDEGYQTLTSLLLSAQMSGKKITVRAVDDAGSDFCRLERVIIYQ